MKNKIRESNIELLRIIAMFLVLLVHVNFFALGGPSVSDIQQNTIDSVLRVFFQSLSIACVDIFVFISGWFGINVKLKGFCNFIFQCLFFLIGLYFVTILLGTSQLSKEGLLGCIAATKLNWFIKAYVLLYIMSPVLNAFVKDASRVHFRNVLVGFYVFQFVYGWIFPGATEHIQHGYSTISFIGLYLLARYIYLYRPRMFDFKPSLDFLIVLGLVVFVTLCYVTPPLFEYFSYRDRASVDKLHISYHNLDNYIYSHGIL